MRWRTLVTGIAIVATIVVYAALVSTVSPMLRSVPWPIEVAAYAVAGFVWILPLRRLVRWSKRDPMPPA